MPITVINGIHLGYEENGSSGVPVVLVHGSWVDRHSWDNVVAALSRRFRVYTYDRRSHGESERLEGQGRIQEDVADLAALIESNDLGPAHVVGNSFGAIVALKLAASQPHLLASLSIHEPPLLGMVRDHPVAAATAQRIGPVIAMLQSGKTEQGAREFVNSVALGPGEWEKLPLPIQQSFVFNASTFLDEISEPGNDAFTVDCERLAEFRRPVLITQGGRSPSFYSLILEKLDAALPNAQSYIFREAGHVPHMSHPDEFAEKIGKFIESASDDASRGELPQMRTESSRT